MTHLGRVNLRSSARGTIPRAPSAATSAASHSEIAARRSEPWRVTVLVPRGPPSPYELSSVAASGTIAGDATYKYDESAYGISYNVATGLDLKVSYSDFTQSGGAAITDVSGSATMVELSVSF